MKKIVLFMLLMLPVTVSAQYYNEIGGLWYYLDKDTNEATVVRQNLILNPTVNIPATVEYKGVSYSVTKIERCAFSGFTKVMNFTIPHSVRFIGEWAFYDTGWYNSQPDGTYLYLDDWLIHGKSGKYYKTSVKIPDGTRGIAERALWKFSFITSITMPNSLIYINDYAFDGCRGLTSVTIPNSVTNIGDNAFVNCNGLTSVFISDLVAWCNIEFSSHGSNPLYKAHHLYINNNEITNLVIPNNVTKIGKYAFYSCNGLTSVTIPISVTSIGSSAFENCNGLTSVTIPNSVTSIGSSAFQDCNSLTSVTIPNSVTSIGSSAFQDCNSLTSVVIGNGMKNIESYAFASCYNIKGFYCYTETPPTLGRLNVFEDFSWGGPDHILRVPKDSVIKYYNSDWRKYFGSIFLLTASDPTSGIEESPTVNHQRDYIYSLSGQRVTNPKPGIYIQGGRKIVIK